MKKSIVLICLGALVAFTNCGDNKDKKASEKITIQSNSETQKETVSAEEIETPNADVIAQGKKLFKDKTCFTCHQTDTKVIGPSIKDIKKIYEEKNASIFKFLKSESEAIVDTEPAQVAIMKANLDGFVKDLSDDEIKALEAYMHSVN